MKAANIAGKLEVQIGMKRRLFKPEFKAKIVMEILKEEETLGEIAARNELNPN